MFSIWIEMKDEQAHFFYSSLLCINRCWGSNANGQLGVSTTSVATISTTPVTVTLNSKVTKLALGKEHTCVSLQDETVWSDIGLTD